MGDEAGQDGAGGHLVLEMLLSDTRGRALNRGLIVRNIFVWN